MPHLKIKSLLLVRHAHRSDDGDQPSPGLGLAPLSELGQKQALAFADSITERPDLILVSTFVRSVQTATPLNERFPDTPVETWPIHEFTFLPPELFTGTTFRDREPQNTAYWKAENPDLHPGPGGESFREFIDRVDAVLARLSKRCERFVIMISHGYTMQAMLWRWIKPARAIDATAMADWNQFRARWNFAPTDSVELKDGLIQPLRPAPFKPLGGEIRA